MTRRRLGLPFSLQRGQLNLLNLADHIAGFIPQHDDGQDRCQSESGRHGKGAPRKSRITAFEQIVGTDGQHEYGSRHIAGADRMNKFHLGNRIKKQLLKTGQFHAHGFEIKFRPYRILHPGIGNKNPQGRKIGTQGH